MFIALLLLYFSLLRFGLCFSFVFPGLFCLRAFCYCDIGNVLFYPFTRFMTDISFCPSMVYRYKIIYVELNVFLERAYMATFTHGRRVAVPITYFI